MSLFLYSFCVCAQNDSITVPLKQVLFILEEQHAVTFSYQDALVEGVFVREIASPLSLFEAIQRLEGETGLVFNTTNSNYITITKPSDIFESRTFLEEIAITAYLTKGITQSKDGSIIINYEDFGILPGLIEADALKTAQALPGVESVDETVSNLSIRGGTHDQNLILLDGIKMYQSGHFFGLISAFNNNLTKTATVFKNGTPAKYTDGVSGTLVLESAQQVSDSLSGGIGTNLIYGEGFIDVPIGGKASVQLSARSSINDLAETPTFTSYFNAAFQDTEITNSSDNIQVTNDQFSFFDTSVKLDYQITTKDYLQANALLVHNELNFNENTLVQGNQESRRSGTQQDNLAGGLTYTRKWSTNVNSEAQLYGTRYHLEAVNADILNNQRLIQENEVLESGVRLDTKIKISNVVALDNGYHFVETGVTNSQDVDNPLFRRTVKDVVRRHAIYSQLNYNSSNNNTFVNIGTRVNYIEKFGVFLVEPRLAVSQKISNSLTLKLQGEFKHQVATQVIEFQNDFLGVENRRWILADNDSIPIVKSKQVSLGLGYKKNGWLISAEGFTKRVDGITTQSQGFQNQFRFAKTSGSFNVYGLETLIYKTYAQFKSWLTYSYTKNDYTFNALIPRQFPNNNELQHSFTLGTSYTYNRLNLSLGLNYRTGRPTTVPNFENPISNNRINFEMPNAERLEDYFRVDFSANYQFKISKRLNGFAGLSLWNIFGTNATINQYFQVGDQNTLLNIQQSALGFTPNAALKVLF